MKKTIFTILSIAAIFTSCDKNNVESPVTALDAIEAGLDVGVVGFSGEDLKSKGPALNNPAGRALDITHVYQEDASHVQMLTIWNDEVPPVSVYQGTYEPGNIGGGLTAVSGSLTLPYGSYSISTEGSATASGVVSSFLPYTSAVSFELDADLVNVNLEATLLRGALFVGLQGAAVTSAEAVQGSESGDLISTSNFLYGYVNAGSTDINATYTIGADESTDSTNFDVENGKHYTFYPGVVDIDDAIIETVVGPIASGGTSSTVTGSFSAWSPENDADTSIATITQTRSRDITVTTSAAIETTTTSYAVQINGIEDIPALVAASDVVSIVTITAEDISVTAESETRDIANPLFIAPTQTGTVVIGGDGAGTGLGGSDPTADAPDTIEFGAWVLGTETGGDIDISTAASNVLEVTETTSAVERIDTRDYSVVIVGDADAVAPVADAADLTRTVTVTPASERQIANPAYVAPQDPLDTFSAFSVWAGTDPGFGAQLTREENSSIAPAASSEEFTTESYDLVTYQEGYSYNETRTRSIIINGEQDAVAPTGDLSEDRQVLIDENIVSTVASTRQVANSAYVAPSGDPKDLDNDGDVDIDDAIAAGFTVDVSGAIGGWSLEYSTASGLTNVLVSNTVINTYFFGITSDVAEFSAIVDAARATEYANAQVLAAYVAS